ncbi:hypothetical protein [Streptacidiphilus neutrinimicus]|uniref:hypothetical protein n=1 Tax=Streptacidiphilus neutrinimicus TaxID=105420 RepID=UPI000B11CF17|nr:hypothetical protein [Streptacidiphilus neutrinimicus]
MAILVGVALLLATVRWSNHRPHHAILALVVGILIANTGFGVFVHDRVETGVHTLDRLP